MGTYYLTVEVSQAISSRLRYWVTLVASILLGLVFISSGLGKLLGQSAFLFSITSSTPISPLLASFIATWLPWAELALGLALIAGVLSQLAATLSIILSATFIFHNSWIIAHGLGSKPCGCLGIIDKVIDSNMSTISALYVDIGLFVLALAIYFAYSGKFLNLRPWFLGRGKGTSGSSNQAASVQDQPTIDHPNSSSPHD
jgi:uncharacterized membrane protein YphA (DoxX/SURF4 family)